MNTKEAKDILVEFTAEQAALDGVPFTDVEKRMLYFTESDPLSCSNPIELNAEFETQCETEPYEAKVSRLVHRAYTRLKKEAPEKARIWNEAVRELEKGDHYFLVMWDMNPPSESGLGDSLKLLGAGLFVAVSLVTAMLLADKFDVDINKAKNYVPIVVIVLVLSFSGLPRLVVRLLPISRYRRTKKDQQPS